MTRLIVSSKALFLSFRKSSLSSQIGYYTLDLYEDKDNVYVRAEVPGVKKEDIEISLHEGTLTLSGERKADKRVENAEAIRAERLVGQFSRSVALPSPIQGEKVTASYRDGILSVILPKAEESKPKQIKIKG